MPFLDSNGLARVWEHIVTMAATKSDEGHNHDDEYYTEAEIDEKVSEINASITSTYETKADAASKLSEATAYADEIKNDLLNGAGAAYDTLKELGDLIDDNQEAIDALEVIATGKQDKLTGTQTQLVGFNSSGNAIAIDAITDDYILSMCGTSLNGNEVYY